MASSLGLHEHDDGAVPRPGQTPPQPAPTLEVVEKHIAGVDERLLAWRSDGSNWSALGR
jgi:hypothetical protein